jgi:GT2 family glycosyltransferase
VDSIPKGTFEVKLIVPVLNRYDLLQRMVDSIDIPLELLVLDNGDELEALKVPAWVDARVLHLPTNQGVAGSWNLGIKLLPFEPVWFFTSADTQYEPGALAKLAEAKTDEITLNASFPYWQTFAIGEEVVRRIGLFDENIFPIYFEDNDYNKRATEAGITVTHIDAPVHHDNSSTINSDANLREQNSRTFQSNEQYFHSKTEGLWHWSLDRRRANYWQK